MFSPKGNVNTAAPFPKLRGHCSRKGEDSKEQQCATYSDWLLSWPDWMSFRLSYPGCFLTPLPKYFGVSIWPTSLGLSFQEGCPSHISLGISLRWTRKERCGDSVLAYVLVPCDEWYPNRDAGLIPHNFFHGSWSLIINFGILYHLCSILQQYLDLGDHEKDPEKHLKS